MKIDVNYIFLEKHVDPLYQMIGLQADFEEIEVLREGVLDLSKVVAAYASFDKSWDKLSLSFGNGENYYIDLPFEQFRLLWMTV